MGVDHLPNLLVGSPVLYGHNTKEGCRFIQHSKYHIMYLDIQETNFLDVTSFYVAF